jgi:hypothetical protein
MLAMKGSDLTGAWIRTLNAVAHETLAAASKLERDPNEETAIAQAVVNRDSSGRVCRRMGSSQ